MSIIASTNRDKDFEPAPAGVHQAVCVDVVDLGLLKTEFQGQTRERHKITIAWQISENRNDGKPYLVHKRYTLSLHEKSTLRKDLESWRGKRFTFEEEVGFDVEQLIGVNALLNIQPSDDGQYANVIAIMPLQRGMAPMKARDFVRKKDRESAPEPITADEIPF